jgi:hypothetical protein
MTLPRRGLVFFVCLQALLLTSARASAQNWSFDARNIGMGGVGSTSNIAADMIDEQRRYRAIVLPFGLFQVLPNLPKLDPTKDDFDLIRAIEYAASPIHYIVGRDDTSTASAFVNDIRNGELSRDLNDYRGFTPATSLSAEGLASPNWGYTFKIKKDPNGPFQGIYAGAGMYFSMTTLAEIDPALAQILGSPTPVYIPNTSFTMSNDTESQFAMAITGGYRARFPWPGRPPGSGRGANAAIEGLYVGANYHFLRGFLYEHFQPGVRLDTNSQGLLTVNLAKGLPVTILRNASTNGTGFAIDTGVAAVVGPWEAGVGVNGIANRIDWTGVEETDYFLDTLFNGGDFTDLPGRPVDDVRVELPVDVRGHVRYNSDRWSATSEFGHGYNDTSFRVGYEQRLGWIDLRGGARFVNDRWEPTGGAGFNLSPGFGIDVGVFGTSANLERKRHMAVAFSLRFMAKNP